MFPMLWCIEGKVRTLLTWEVLKEISYLLFFHETVFFLTVVGFRR